MKRQTILNCSVLCALAITCAGAGSNWKLHVSADYRNRVNPYAGQKEAVAAGAKLFREYCAPCHGKDALGVNYKPSLRTRDVQLATDGELLWLLKNGERRRGMPSWNSLPEPSRWQIVAFIKSLGSTGTAKPTIQEKEGQQ
jgi:mono/diheme cytochrome c family protein